MAKKPTKATSRALATKQPQQPPAPIAGTSIIPDARYREPSRHPIRSGPWQGEFEKTAWTDPATGYPCIILRQPRGELAGFVGVEPAHPLAGYKVDALPPSVGEGLHRPLNYAEPCQSSQNERVSVCHVVHAPSRPSRSLHRGNAHEAPDDAQADRAWWFGMTMNGPTDLIPTLPGGRLAAERGQTYRDEAFVYRQVVELARQLKAVEEAAKSGSSPRSLSGPPLALPAGRKGDK